MDPTDDAVSLAGPIAHAGDCGCACCAAARAADPDPADPDPADPDPADLNRAGAAGDGRAAASYVSPGDHDAAGLIAGARWLNPHLTYAFPKRAMDYDTSFAAGLQYGSGEAADGFAPFSARQIVAAEAALAQFAAVSGLSFTRLPADQGAAATIRFAQSDAPSTAWGYYPSAAAEGGDAWFAEGDRYLGQPTRGTYGWHTIIHEIGHTVGLKHGHEGAGLPHAEDSMEHSVMTYRSYVGDTPGAGYANEFFGYAQTLMQADIAALQALYGANYSHQAGDTVYRWDDDTGEAFVNGAPQGAPGVNRIFETVWDGGGVDTFDFSNFAAGLSVNLAPGAGTILEQGQRAWLNLGEGRGAEKILASGSVYTARLFEGDERGLIENATGGGGGDRIAGNQARNLLNGGDGDDTLLGFAGGDKLRGGVGDDSLLGGAARDRLIGGAGGDALFGDAGRDILRGGAGDDGLFGGEDDDRVLGGRDDDRLFGGAGADRIVGGRGDDSLTGGAGDDVLRGGGGADIFIFAPGDGNDRIVAFAPGIDRLDLTGFSPAARGAMTTATVGDDLLLSLEGTTITLLRLGVDGIAGADLLV